MSLTKQQELEKRYVMPTFGRKPVEFVSGNGMTLVDDQGKSYLDFLSGIGVCSLGHCHPVLVSALQKQAEKLIHVSNYYYIEQRGELAERLSQLLNEQVEGEAEDWKTFFANSGAEANECAIKLARLYKRKQFIAEGKPGESAPRTIVVLNGSFHGRTLATLAATAQPVKQEEFMPLPSGFQPTPLNDVAALEELFATQGDSIAAVMLECVQGESGVHPCTPEFIEAVRRLTNERDALFIADEVQCGMFRCATPYGFQQFNVLPDIVTMAKGIASGMVMGACAAKAHVADAFEPGEHGSTFGGSNLAVAAAAATIQEISKPEFRENVEKTGAYLREKLAQLPKVTESRGFGLMVGADLSDDAKSAPEVVSAALEAGLVLNAPGPHTLRFLPPLVCTEDEVDILVEKLAGIL